MAGYPARAPALPVGGVSCGDASAGGSSSALPERTPVAAARIAIAARPPIGDADVGEGANVGAGAITCNYDGIAKHRTTIEAGAFIGSNASLVAPVTIGEGAFVAAGSTITDDVPSRMLALGRARQRLKEIGSKEEEGGADDR